MIALSSLSLLLFSLKRSSLPHLHYHSTASSSASLSLYEEQQLQQQQSKRKSLVGCWDDCFDISALSLIEQAGKQRSHSFTSVFDRRQQARTPLECAIQSLLNELDNNNDTHDFYVEYWWRDAIGTKIRSLEAHRDIDETLARQQQTPVSLGSQDKIGTQVCPSFGHVFYVEVSSVLAPTLVFEEVNSGGGPPRSMTNVWSVPARSNRLLRFRGDCIHGVTYPPLQWLHNNVPVSTYNADNKKNDNEEHKRRAVLLFNTWTTPPLYPPVGETLARNEQQQEQQSNSKLGVPASPKSLWIPTAIVSSPPPVVKESKEEDIQMTTTATMSLFTVPLLGEFSRRGCKESSLAFHVDKEQAIAALTSNSTIHGLQLHTHTSSSSLSNE